MEGKCGWGDGDGEKQLDLDTGVFEGIESVGGFSSLVVGLQGGKKNILRQPGGLLEEGCESGAMDSLEDSESDSSKAPKTRWWSPRIAVISPNPTAVLSDAISSSVVTQFKR